MPIFSRQYLPPRIWVPPYARPAWDSTGTVGTDPSNTGSLTSTIVIGARANAVVASIVWYDTVTTDTVTAKVGSTSMTQLGIAHLLDVQVAGNYVYGAMFGLRNSGLTGSQTITYTLGITSYDYATANSIAYRNVTGFGTAATNTGSTTSMSLSVPSAPSQMVTQMFCAAGGTTDFNISAYNQTQRYNFPSGTTQTINLGDAPGAASTSFTATLGGTESWVGIGVPLL